MTEIAAAVKLIVSMRFASIARERNSYGLAETVVMAVCGKFSKMQKHRRRNAASSYQGPSGCVFPTRSSAYETCTGL
jgi:hypothetical protein